MTTRITVSLPDHLVEQVRREVEEGKAASVSAYVADALEEKVPAIGLRELLRQWDQELGPPGPEAEAWADEQARRLGWTKG